MEVKPTTYQPTPQVIALEDGFFWLNMIQYGVAALLHCTGLVVLCKYPKQTNQSMILFYLSLTEINLVVPGVTLRIHLDKVSYLTVPLKAVLYSIEDIGMIQLVFIMYILTIDRLICSINPLKYRYRVTRKRIRIPIMAAFAFSIIVAVAKEVVFYFFNDHYSLLDSFIYYYFLISGGAYVLLAVITYAFIFWAARKSRALSCANGGAEGSVRKRFLISSLIILTFLLLYVIPYTFHGKLLFNLNDFHETLMNEITRTVMLVGLTADPVIYIFLSKQYRDMIIAKYNHICMSCRKNLNRNQVDSQTRARTGKETKTSKS